MAFDEIIGQARVWRLLRKALLNGRISHAYLLVGQPGVGKEALALALARHLLALEKDENDPLEDARVRNLTHPDVRVVFPSPSKLKEDDRARIVASIAADPYQRLRPWANPSISIDQIREIRRQASYKSFEGNGRVFVIYDCDMMTVEASNSLLKVLEEPPPNMYLIMTSSKPSLLLPTIISRSQIVKCAPLTTSEIAQALEARGVSQDKASLVARLSDGNFRRALDFLNEDLQEVQTLALNFFRQSVQNEFRQLIYVHEILAALQRDLRAVKELLTHALLWVRDAWVYKEIGDVPDFLIHDGQADVLRKFNQHFPNAGLHAAAREIEYAFELMERNVQINLILIVLLNKLRHYIRG